MWEKMVIFAFLFVLFIAGGASASQIIYYHGSETRTMLNGAPEVHEELIMTKTYAPETQVLSEVACVWNTSDTQAKAKISPVFMKVENPQTITAISDNKDFTAGVLTGTGQLEGKTWDWNYLKFSMSYRTPGGIAQIEDENWVSANYLIGIKEMLNLPQFSGHLLPDLSVQKMVRKYGQIGKETLHFGVQTAGGSFERRNGISFKSGKAIRSIGGECAQLEK